MNRILNILLLLSFYCFASEARVLTCSALLNSSNVQLTLGQRAVTLLSRVTNRLNTSYATQPTPIRIDPATVNDLQTKVISKMVKTERGRTAFLVIFEDGSKAIFKPDVYNKMNLNTSKYEVAAFKISSLLKMGMIPTTTSRDTKIGFGAIQEFVEGKHPPYATFLHRDLWPIEVTPHDTDMMKMHIFDFLIYNTDRRESNVLIDSSRKLVLIDHTYAFHSGIRGNPYLRREEPLYLPSLQFFFSTDGKAFLKKIRLLSTDQLQDILPEL